MPEKSASSKSQSPNASGSLGTASETDVPGTQVLGVTAHVNLATVLVTIDFVADSTGFVEVPVAIPPGSVGAQIFGQFFWVNTPSCGNPNPSGLSASSAIDIVVQ